MIGTSLDSVDSASTTACMPADEIGDRLLDPVVRDLDRLHGRAAIEHIRRTAASIQWPAHACHCTMQRARRHFFAHAAPFGIALTLASLPETYCAQRGVQALGAHGRLEHNYPKRMATTLRWLRHVMDPQVGENDRSKILAALVDVRIMHALARERIRRMGHWDAQWGTPISQEGQLATMQAFSTRPIAALRSMSIPVDTDQEADLLHTWGVYTQVLGVDDHRIPTDPGAAHESWRQIALRNFEPSSLGRRLAALHCEFAARLLLPAPVSHRVISAACRTLIGSNHSQLLGLPSSNRLEASAAHTILELVRARAYTQAKFVSRARRIRNGRALIRHLEQRWSAAEPLAGSTTQWSQRVPTGSLR